MQLVGFPWRFAWALARVLDAQRADDDQHLGGASQTICFQNHSPKPRVDRQRRQSTAEGGEPLVWLVVTGPKGTKFFEQGEAILHRPLVGRFDEWKALDCPELVGSHAEEHGGEVCTENFWISERLAGRERLFPKQPDRNTWCNAPTTSASLVCRGL